MKSKTEKLKRKEKIISKNFSDYEKTQKLASSWNPLPKREDFKKKKRLNLTIEKRAGFINCNHKYFNKGKFKGVSVFDTPLYYITWVKENIELNKTEIQLVNKAIKNKKL